MDLRSSVQSVEEDTAVVLMILCHWYVRDHEGDGEADGGVWKEYWMWRRMKKMTQVAKI